MAGTPGTPRFGVNPNPHSGSASANGSSTDQLQDGMTWKEVHFAYNPGQVSREMGTTQGAEPKQQWQMVDHMTDYMCNHDGYDGGSPIILQLDERKVLENRIYSIMCEYDDDSPNGNAPAQTKGKFD